MAVDDTLKRPEYKKRSLVELVAAGGTLSPPPAPAPVAVAEEQDYSPPPKKSDPLPKPGDRYRPYARFLNRMSEEQKYLHFIHGDFACVGFAYHDLRRVTVVPADKPGNGPSLVLRFIECVVVEITISGRNLDDLHYYLSEWWMPWVWEQPKGFKTASDQATVITGIDFRELEK